MDFLENLLYLLKNDIISKKAMEYFGTWEQKMASFQSPPFYEKLVRRGSSSDSFRSLERLLLELMLFVGQQLLISSSPLMTLPNITEVYSFRGFA